MSGTPDETTDDTTIEVGLASVTAAIAHLDVYADGTRRILLDLGAKDPDRPFSFAAGQHLLVHVPDGEPIPFSIASSPARLPEIELHYAARAGSAAAAAMDALLARQRTVELEGPFGDIAIRHANPRPLVMIVAGTGAAQAQSIVEHLQASDPVAPVSLFWHVPDRAACYCHERFVELAELRWFHYAPVIAGAATAQSARRWLAPLASRIAGSDLILCGSPDFVYRIVDALAALGIEPASMGSDVFSYAPR